MNRLSDEVRNQSSGPLSPVAWATIQQDRKSVRFEAMSIWFDDFYASSLQHRSRATVRIEVVHDAYLAWAADGRGGYITPGELCHLMALRKHRRSHRLLLNVTLLAQKKLKECKSPSLGSAIKSTSRGTSG